MQSRRILRVSGGLSGLSLAAAGLLLLGCERARTAEVNLPGATELADSVVRLDAAEARRVAEQLEGEISVELAEGLEVRLWASEALMIDPIAIDIDHQGRVFVTGNERSWGPLDIRGHPGWMTEALALRSVEDLRSFLRRDLAPERSDENQWLEDYNQDGVRDWRDLTVQKERVYRLEDTSGDGRADVSQLMVKDFHTEVTDVAGGLLVHGGDLYLGVAPDVWRLRDRTGNGVIETKESISHGYGTHRGFGGHGVSGVTLGPDGRIYWSVGDMGFNVVDREGRRWEYPSQGAVFRSEPDGSGFEVFALGLRNTHEFAFDEYGNLISSDNDGDHPGETERLVYLVDGSDSGWRVNWQFGKYTDPENNDYKVWMDEGLYRPRFEGQAAYIVPPLASFHTGPTGLVYNPGTALSERWRNHFFVSAFTGSSATARIHAFSLRPNGAGFELANDTVLLSGLLTVGMQFGPDGALYLADWLEGWATNGAGRIWRLDAPEAAAAPQRAETRALLAEDFGRRSVGDLQQLLAHPDKRVRLKAQFALVDRSANNALLASARESDQQLARIHALWGIGQLARRNVRRAEPLTGFLGDPDAEIRAQAAKLIGDVRYARAADALMPLLRDESARVRFFAAEALGRIGHRAAVEPLIEMLAENDDRDVYLRHAGSLALARIGDAEPVLALADHPSRAVRIAAVVALRRLQHPGVARFLGDADEYVVTEAARAINDDASIEAALPALARLLEQPRFTNEPLLRRVINANVRVGTPEAAQRLAVFATRDAAPEPLRVEAVAALGVLPSPSVLDRVDGKYRGPVERDPAIARAALEPVYAALLEDRHWPLRVAVAEAAGRVALQPAAPALLARAQNDPEAYVRVVALQALHAMRAPEVDAAIRTASADPDASVRMTAIGLVPALGLPAATAAELLAATLERGSVVERQSALHALGELRTAEANQVLAARLTQLEQGRLATPVQLDLIEAVQASGSAELLARLEQWQAARADQAPIVRFAEALEGGDAGRGRQIVFQNPSGQCTRCHTFNNQGPDVGPSLRGVGIALSRRELLESLVDPSARIAPGYGHVALTLSSGESVTGLLQQETPTHLVVQAGGESRRFAKAEVAQRINAPSAMPSMEHLLTRREIRDVVEYLSTLR
jgi:quinoprotein glucose dehydrogenase